MTEEYQNAFQAVIELAGCAVNGTTPDPAHVAAMNLPQVYAAAKRQQLASCVGMALQSAGITDASFTEAIAKAQRKNALLDADNARSLPNWRKQAFGICH